MLFLSLFTVADPLERPKARRVAEEDAPTVDVFVPSYNESIEIVAPTLAAAKRLRYPQGKLNVFLLDDGATEEKLQSDDPALHAAPNRRESLQAVCADSAPIICRARTTSTPRRAISTRARPKPGRSRRGVRRRPRACPGFPDRDCRLFRQDEKLFLVQTPHFFLNPDPIERNIGAVGMPAENEMFYGLVQKGLDKWNAAFFCGSAAVASSPGARRGRRFSRLVGHRGRRDRAGTARARLEQRLCRQAADRRAAAGDVRVVYRPAFALGRGMVEILLMKNPLFHSRPEPSRSGCAICRAACSGSSRCPGWCSSSRQSSIFSST